MAIVYIALGSNLGDRKKNIQAAVSLLSLRPDIKIKKISSIIETEPEAGLPQGRFLNGVIETETALPPEDLLRLLKKTEANMGRQKSVINGPRVIDLDILFYDGKIIDKPDLKIPHPRLHKRAFVLKPLCEIAGDFVHPVLKESIAVLASRLRAPKLRDKAISLE